MPSDHIDVMMIWKIDQVKNHPKYDPLLNKQDHFYILDSVHLPDFISILLSFLVIPNVNEDDIKDTSIKQSFENSI